MILALMSSSAALAVIGSASTAVIVSASMLALLFLLFGPKLVTDNLYSGQIQMGQSGGIKVQYGSAHFVTTGTTLALPCKFSQIRSIQLTWMGAPATDETLYGPDIPDGSTLAVGATGTITITRVGASPTSALGFYYTIYGN